MLSSYKHYFRGSSKLINCLHPLAIEFWVNTKKSQPDLFPPILLHRKTISRTYTERIREGKRLAAWTCYLQPVTSVSNRAGFMTAMIVFIVRTNYIQCIFIQNRIPSYFPKVNGLFVISRKQPLSSCSIASK